MTPAGRPAVSRLIGGPHSGQVAETKMDGPAVLLTEPRSEHFLDPIDRELIWNPGVEWYETREAAAVE